MHRYDDSAGARTVEIFGVASGDGGRDPGAVHGPAALRTAGLPQRLQAAGARAAWRRTFAPVRAPGQDALAVSAGLAARVAPQIADSVRRGSVPLVIGGDHSCAVGTWSGVHAAMRPRGALGLVWVDAHLDSHTPGTSHTGLPYGMPLASLLGHGHPDLVACGGASPKLDPRHVCVVGARSWEPEEAALLRDIGVRVIRMDEVARRGFAAALDEAVTIARAASGGYGVTLDLDAIDPADAPGVGTPVEGGIAAAELLAAWPLVRGLAALEIAEYNPLNDRGGRTAALVAEVAGAALAPLASTADLGAR